MATINKFTIKNYSIVKVLDSSYQTTVDQFEIPSGTYLVGAGVFIIVQSISWEAVIDSSDTVSVYFSKERLEQLGNGRWPFELRATFSNGHVSTLGKGDLTITPYL